MKDKHILRRLTCLLMCLIILSSCVNTGNKDNNESNFSSEDVSNVEVENVTIKNVDANLKIGIKAPSNYSKEAVLKGIKFENVSSPIFTSGKKNLVDPDILVATGSKGSFKVYEEGGFKKGDIYQITLTDNKLSFDGYGSNIREYNFTVKGEEVLNAKLNDEISYMSSSSLSKDDASKVMSFDGLLKYDADSGVTTANAGGGSFKAESGLYSCGDIVAVYEGMLSASKVLADTQQSIAYVKITDVKELSGGKAQYYYESCTVDEILFVPDVIPVKEAPKYANGIGNSSYTLESMTFSSNSEYHELGVDENTQVDVGDYLCFFKGDKNDGEVIGYAIVTDVSYTDKDNVDMVNVKYKEVTLEDMMKSMDYYSNITLTEEEIRASYNEAELKENVLNDMNEAGLLSASTYDLVEAVLGTDEVKEAFGDTDIESLNFYFGEDESVQLSGEAYTLLSDPNNSLLTKPAEIKGDSDIKVSPNVVHFAGKTGYGSGVRVEAFAKYVVTIRPDDSSAKTALRINLVFYFEAELVMGITVDATSVWEYAWGFFPYLSDYSITGSFSDGIYVGAGFTTVATLIKNEKEKTEEEKLAGLDWPSDEIIRTGAAIDLMKLANFVKKAGDKYSTIFPAQDTGGGSLAQKYKAFATAANNSDWVDIFDHKFFDWNKAFLYHIIAFRLKADFVVSTELHVAIGVAINYENAYIENFNFLLFSQGYSSKTIENKTNSTFRYDVYMFGAAGIRAGLRIKMMVGLIDARLDGLGLELEGGLYARFRGYLYGGIEIKNVGDSYAKDHVYFSGGFLADVGAYISVTFVAELADGQIAYRKVITNKEFPFFYLGAENITLDFAYEDSSKNNLQAEFSRTNLKALLPESIATMSSMSLRTGELTKVDYIKENLTKYYEITFSDKAFSYKFEDGKQYVVLDYNKRDKSNEGTVTMTLKWIGDEGLAFTTDTLIRKFDIKWECDKTSIVFRNKDGSTFHTITKHAGAQLTKEDFPQKDPVAKGFIFLGWSLLTDPDCTIVTSFPDVMPDHNVTYTSEWDRTHVNVTVEYLEPSGTNPYTGATNYVAVEVDVIPDIYYTDDKIDNIIDELRKLGMFRFDKDCILTDGIHYYDTHYSVNERESVLSGTVAANGSTVFKLALVWEHFDVTFDCGDGKIEKKSVGYNSTFEFPKLTREGYRIKGWKDENGNMVSAETKPTVTKATTYTAVWEPIPTTITVKAQIKTPGMSTFVYYWKDIKIQTFEIDKDEISVRELVELIAVEGYTFEPSLNSDLTLDSMIKVTPHADKLVTLRFK